MDSDGGKNLADAIDAGCIGVSDVKAACELAVKENKIVWFTVDDDTVDPSVVAGIIEGRLDTNGQPTNKTE